MRSTDQPRALRRIGRYATPAGTGAWNAHLHARRSSVPLSDSRVTCVINGGIVQVDVDQRGEFRADFPEGVFDLVISSRDELSLTLRGVGIHDAVSATLVPPTGTPLYGIAGTQTYASQTDRIGAFIIHGIKPGEYDVVVRTAQRTLSNERVLIADHRIFKRHDLRLMVTI